MTIASALTALNTDIVNARTAITNKGGTVTVNGGSSQLATDIATIPTGEQDIEPSAFYDDSGTKIGCYFMNFTDANNTTYKVISLNTFSNGKLVSVNTASITDLPIYTSYVDSNPWKTKETATFNTQKILDFCTANNYTSAICEFCRSKSYVINGTTYYGQLANIVETRIFSIKFSQIKLINTSLTSGYEAFTSTQCNSGAWFMSSAGGFDGYNRASTRRFYPILEIPL